MKKLLWNNKFTILGFVVLLAHGYISSFVVWITDMVNPSNNNRGLMGNIVTIICMLVVFVFFTLGVVREISGLKTVVEASSPWKWFVLAIIIVSIIVGVILAISLSKNLY